MCSTVMECCDSGKDYIHFLSADMKSVVFFVSSFCKYGVLALPGASDTCAIILQYEVVKFICDVNDLFVSCIW